MRFSKVLFVFSLVSSFLFHGCNESSTSGMPSYSGRVGEIVVVSTKAQWESEIGNAVRFVFLEEQYGLPQDEPYFKLISTTEDKFRSIFKTYRNIFVVSIDTNLYSEPKLLIRKDVYAKGQHIVEARAANAEDFNSLMDAKKGELIKYFNKTELERLYRRNSNYVEKQLVAKIKNKFGIEFNPHKGGVLTKETENAFWIRWEYEQNKGGMKHQISQGLFVYSYPYLDEKQFSDSSILAQRDFMLEQFIPGPNEGSYMTTEYRYVPPSIEQTVYQGEFAKEIRGLWKLEKGFMGGPMLSLAMYDKLNNRMVVANGYVFAPEFDKREHLREVEAMVKSIKFTEMSLTDTSATD